MIPLVYGWERGGASFSNCFGCRFSQSPAPRSKTTRSFDWSEARPYSQNGSAAGLRAVCGKLTARLTIGHRHRRPASHGTTICIERMRRPRKKPAAVGAGTRIYGKYWAKTCTTLKVDQSEHGGFCQLYYGVCNQSQSHCQRAGSEKSLGFRRSSISRHNQPRHAKHNCTC